LTSGCIDAQLVRDFFCIDVKEIRTDFLLKEAFRKGTVGIPRRENNISGFCRGVNAIFALLGCYAA
jgi:hypothetical protein